MVNILILFLLLLYNILFIIYLSFGTTLHSFSFHLQEKYVNEHLLVSFGITAIVILCFSVINIIIKMFLHRSIIKKNNLMTLTHD